MRPGIALAVTFPYNDEGIREMLNKWIAAYQFIAEEHPVVEEKAEMLIGRARLAYQIFLERKKVGLEFSMNIVSKEEALDGDFILGNTKDAEFARYFFSVVDMAKMQLGYAYEVKFDIREEDDEIISDIKRGFFEELEGRWKSAEKYYSLVEEDLVDEQKCCIRKRIEYCKETAVAKGAGLYEKGMAMVRGQKFEDAWYFFFDASRLEHPQAMAAVGYMEAYGIGVTADKEDA